MGEKYRAIVDVEIIGDRTQINISQPTDQTLDIESLGKIFAGGLALTIRNSDREAEFMREIMDYLTSEFINPDSFEDSKKFI